MTRIGHDKGAYSGSGDHATRLNPRPGGRLRLQSHDRAQRSSPVQE